MTCSLMNATKILLREKYGALIALIKFFSKLIIQVYKVRH